MSGKNLLVLGIVVVVAYVAYKHFA